MNATTAPAHLQQAISHAKTKWLCEWLHLSLPEMMGLTDSDQDIAKAVVWGESLEALMIERGLDTPDKQKNRWTDTRNALKALDPNHPALKVVGLTTEEFQAINTKARDSLHDRQTKFITNPQAIVEKAVQLLDSREWSEVALGIAVLTGRRCSEILISRFEYQTEFSLSFSKPVKRGNEGVPLNFEIPTLASAQQVLEAIAKLHQWLRPEGLTPRDINSKYEEAIKRASGRHFSGLVPTREGHDELYTHLFRSVYAVIAAHWYCPPTVNELDFRAAIQGHFEILDDPNQSHRLNLMSQRHYWDYQISDGNGNIDGRLGIKLGEPGVVVLERFRPASSRANTASSHRAIAEDSANNTIEASDGATAGTTDEATNRDASPSPDGATDEATDGATNADTSLSSDAISKSASDSTPVLSDNHSTSTVQQPQFIDSDVTTPVLTSEASIPAKPKKRHWSKRPIAIFSDTRKRFEAIAKQWRLPEAESVDRLLDLAERTLANPTEASDAPRQSTATETPVVAQPLIAATSTPLTFDAEAIEALNEALTTAKTLTEQLIDHTRLQQLTTELEATRSQLAEAQQLIEQQQQQIEAIAQDNQHLASQLDAVRSRLQFLFGGSPSQPTQAAPKKTPSAKTQDNTPPTAAVNSQTPDTNTPLSRRGRSVDRGTLSQINHAIDQIIAYNNAPDRSWDEKWAITLSTLKKHRVVTCAQETIANVLQQRREEIEAHHKLHGLGSHHNRRHQAHIKDVIDFA